MPPYITFGLAGLITNGELKQAFSVPCELLVTAPIEIYYDARHGANVDSLIANAKHTLAYFQNNFGAYPHKVVRFAEVSVFAEGFAATAYPGVIYMNEDGGFHNSTIEVGIYTADGQMELFIVNITGEHITGKLKPGNRPVRLVLDPHLKTMDSFLETTKKPAIKIPAITCTHGRTPCRAHANGRVPWLSHCVRVHWHDHAGADGLR